MASSDVARCIKLLTRGLREVSPLLSADAMITTVLGTPTSPGGEGAVCPFSAAIEGSQTGQTLWQPRQWMLEVAFSSWNCR